MSKKMHIVLAFILSIFSTVLVVMNYNQYNELEVIESKRSIAVHATYPQFKSVPAPVQVADNSIYKEIKPYKSTSRGTGQTLQQPGVLSGNFSTGSISRPTNEVGSFQNFNVTTRNFGKADRNNGITLVGQNSPGGVNMISNNSYYGQSNFGYSAGSFSQRSQDRPQSELIARGQSTFGSDMFGSTDAGPSFAKSDIMFNPLSVDPGGDPEDPGEMIPVPDGLLFLIFAAIIYGFYLLSKKS
jgi:hypothetical protein